MAVEDIKKKKLTDDELDEVAGGDLIDRFVTSGWVQHYYGENGTRGKIINTVGKSSDEVMSEFCERAGIEHQKNSGKLDQYKINGEWCDAVWLAYNKDAALAFFDQRLGISQ